MVDYGITKGGQISISAQVQPGRDLLFVPVQLALFRISGGIFGWIKFAIEQVI